MLVNPCLDYGLSASIRSTDYLQNVSVSVFTVVQQTQRGVLFPNDAGILCTIFLQQG